LNASDSWNSFASASVYVPHESNRDLNADLGEGSGHDEQLFELISSANVATGFHAGDADSMHAAVSAAKALGVAVGAHPSFWDRENFGRKELNVSAGEVFDAMKYQLGIFQAIAAAAGIQPNHVKPHGALTTWRYVIKRLLTP
jgi:UPF0271 protein